MSNDGKFVLKNTFKLSEIAEDYVIPESDLTLQHGDLIRQFEFKVTEDEDKEKFIIKPGSYLFENTNRGLILKKLELKKLDLLSSIDNTSKITSEGDKFFSRLHIYDQIKTLKSVPKKRSILLHSPPGVGKTSAITEVCHKYLKEEGTVVIVWDTAAIRSSSVNDFFMASSIFQNDCKKFIFVIEDINGGTTDTGYGYRPEADSSLLNLLEGVGNPFKIPTFIIATTNNPESTVGALIDRPGRFDKVIELKAPGLSETEELLAFISEKELDEDGKKAAALASKNNFSIAHLQEIVVRSLLDDKTMLEVTEELVVHKKKHAEAFQSVKSIGLNKW